MQVLPKGVNWIPGYLSRPEQEDLLQSIREITAEAPLYVPRMPRSGKAMSVRMTNCGFLGWVTDQEHGYRYQRTHPETGQSWPEIPDALLQIWKEVAVWESGPEACLINYYKPDAKMGMHQDKDEKNLEAPVLSISLGDDCLFRVGGLKRNAPTNSFRLKSGDIVILAGESRLAYHGVDRIYPGTSSLLKQEAVSI